MCDGPIAEVKVGMPIVVSWIGIAYHYDYVSYPMIQHNGESLL